MSGCIACKAQLLLDEAAILACAMYVDLNPIRAAIVQSLEESDFTGAKARIDDLLESKSTKTTNSETSKSAPQPNKEECPKLNLKHKKSTSRWERSQGHIHSGWLSPLKIREATDPIGPVPSPCGRRASLKGFIPMSLLRYLELLDRTGRQIHGDKKGVIPSSVAPILKRFGIQSDRWLDLTRQFGKLFKRAAGSKISISGEANGGSRIGFRLQEPIVSADPKSVATTPVSVAQLN